MGRAMRGAQGRAQGRAQAALARTAGCRRSPAGPLAFSLPAQVLLTSCQGLAGGGEERRGEERGGEEGRGREQTLWEQRTLTMLKFSLVDQFSNAADLDKNRFVRVDPKKKH